MKSGFHTFILCLSLVLGCLVSPWASASELIGLSARRDKNVSATEAQRQAQGPKTFSLGRGPAQFKKPVDQLDFSGMTEVDFEVIQREFAALRDERFLTYRDPSFLRRLTWLFPDDGCYARAELMAKMLAKKNAAIPAKIFAFGDLAVYSSNIPGGIVTWWYHVAIAYRSADTVYVLDPSIDAERPLTAEDWVKRMSVSSYSVEVSLCSAKTFDPNFDCINPKEITEDRATKEITPFLPQEWNRLIHLKRSPTNELGEAPPWKNR